MMQLHSRLSLGKIMAAVLLVTASLLLYFYHLGKTEFYSDPPARIAVYARQMALDNAWLVPTLRNEPRIDIPPLYLWAVKIVSGFSPDLSAFEERLPGAICSLLLILLVAWWVYQHASRYGREDVADVPAEGVALLAGLLIASNPILFDVGREGTLNSMFALLYVAASFCWGESLEARRSFYAGLPWRNWIVWGYLFAGLAMLVRGPLVMPLLWMPYFLATRSYHLRKPDRVHLWGLPLALVIGGFWPLAVSLVHRDLASSVWSQWLAFRIGNQDLRHIPFYEYLWHVLEGSFPWVILAAVMAVRVWRKADRSPTLVYWMSSLLGNLILLSVASFYIGQHRLPVIVFIALLSADSFYRWNFENAWAVLWRVLLRIFLWFATIAGILASILFNSDLGLVFFILIPIGWIFWIIRSRSQGFQYTPWESTIRLTAMTIVVFIAAEAIYLSDWEPRKRFHYDQLMYFKRMDVRLPDRDSALYLYRPGMSVLYDYFLKPQPVLPGKVANLKALPDQDTFIFADRDVKELVRNPRLDPITFAGDGHKGLPREGMLKILPSVNATTTETTAALTQRDPLRVVLLGNSGTRSGDQRDVGRRLTRIDKQGAIDDVLLLGNNLYGPSMFHHLAFIKGFERPYRKLLNRGVTFHAALGHEDQSYAWAQLRYNPFHMNGDRYYVHTLDGGRADIFMLDSETLYEDKKFDEEQLAWLDRALAASAAPWKVVGLYRSLLNLGEGEKSDSELANRLLPLFDKYRVNLVAWSGGQWYARVVDPSHTPVFLNAGWSGGKRPAKLSEDPRIRARYDRRAGFVLVNFHSDRATLEAINTKGEVVDATTLTLTVNPAPQQPPSATPQQVAPAQPASAQSTPQQGAAPTPTPQLGAPQ